MPFGHKFKKITIAKQLYCTNHVLFYFTRMNTEDPQWSSLFRSWSYWSSFPVLQEAMTLLSSLQMVSLCLYTKNLYTKNFCV